MQNSNCIAQNETKKYIKPEFEVVELTGSDVITTSAGGTETPWHTELFASW